MFKNTILGNNYISLPEKNISAPTEIFYNRFGDARIILLI